MLARTIENVYTLQYITQQVAVCDIIIICNNIPQYISKEGYVAPEYCCIGKGQQFLYTCFIIIHIKDHCTLYLPFPNSTE